MYKNIRENRILKFAEHRCDYFIVMRNEQVGALISSLAEQVSIFVCSTKGPDTICIKT